MMQRLINGFIETTNTRDINGALSLFASDAIIDDVSVGDTFVGSEGVRAYLDQFFAGYNTFSKLLSIEILDEFHAVVRLDFTGDFGHEIGTLKIAVNSDGLIERVDADLE